MNSMVNFSILSKEDKITTLIDTLKLIQGVDEFYVYLLEYLGECKLEEVDNESLDHYWDIIIKHTNLFKDQQDNNTLIENKYRESLIQDHNNKEKGEHENADLLLNTL